MVQLGHRQPRPDACLTRQHPPFARTSVVREARLVRQGAAGAEWTGLLQELLDDGELYCWMRVGRLGSEHTGSLQAAEPGQTFEAIFAGLAGRPPAAELEGAAPLDGCYRVLRQLPAVAGSGYWLVCEDSGLEVAAEQSRSDILEELYLESLTNPELGERRMEFGGWTYAVSFGQGGAASQRNLQTGRVRSLRRLVTGRL